MKCVLVVLLASMVANVNSCEFGNEAIQGMYDRAEVFRKTKVFDITNRKVPLVQHYLYKYREDTNGTKFLFMEINDEIMSETYENNAENEILTIFGRYIGFKYELQFRRDENGEMIFEEQNDAFNFTLPSIDAELSNNEYKQVLIDLKTMRRKMFDFQKGLSKDDLEGVQMFDYWLNSDGNFNSLYIGNDGGTITVNTAKKDGKETISGLFTCNNKHQIYNVVDGKVAVDNSKRYFPCGELQPN